MYWNPLSVWTLYLTVPLNSNIRCIEITEDGSYYQRGCGWIVTLDVLKYLSHIYTNNKPACWIVTLDVLKSIDDFSFEHILKLNSNIRCIEMKFYEVSSSDEQVE